MNVSFLFAAHFILLVLTSVAQGLTLYEVLLPQPKRGNPRPRGRKFRERPSEGSSDYQKICRVVNPNPYAFPGSNPFPGVPFCPP